MKDNMLTWEEAVQWLRDQPERSELVKHCYYDDPLENAAERFFQSEEWQEIVEILGNKSSGKVLDIGAGRGISSYAFAKLGYSVIALEPNSSNLVGAGAIHRLAKSSNLDIKVVQEWGETIPFPNDTFDIVYGRAVLHHANNLTQLCKESARVLKTDGYFIATREHVISKKEDLQSFLDTHPLHYLYGGENAYLLDEYIAAISLSGMKLVKTLDPLQSVINYFPMTKLQRKNLLNSFLTRKLGNTIGTYLSKYKFLQEFYTWYISKHLNSPGSLYSFLAVKP